MCRHMFDFLAEKRILARQCHGKQIRKEVEAFIKGSIGSDSETFSLLEASDTVSPMKDPIL
jgi:hypothetical protein